MADIHVNGRTYPLIPVDDLTLDEAIVVYDYCKLSLDEIADLEGFHPGLIAALIHVSVARGEPGETYRSIRQTVGALKIGALEAVFMDVSVEVPDGDPPEAGGPSSRNGGFGGAGATRGGQDPAVSLAPLTGSRGSATGATYDPETSAP